MFRTLKIILNIPADEFCSRMAWAGAKPAIYRYKLNWFSSGSFLFI